MSDVVQHQYNYYNLVSLSEFPKNISVTSSYTPKIILLNQNVIGFNIWIQIHPNLEKGSLSYFIEDFFPCGGGGGAHGRLYKN